MGKICTNVEYVEWLKSRVGDAYWYGTFYNDCTEDLLARKARQYPSHYGKSRMAQYSDDIKNSKKCGDCVGAAIKGAIWSELGKHKPVYGSHGCPDKSADGMFAYCKEQGMDCGGIDSLPDLPGIAVRYAGHVGVYVGGGEVVEWRGFKYGCVVTQLKDRKWTHWYELPWVEYAEQAEPEQPDIQGLGSRILKLGAKGDDVKTLQGILMALGYRLPEYGTDGKYGEETEAAVMAFQADVEIGVDGDYGPITHAALMVRVQEDANQLNDEDETQAPADPERHVVVTGGTVNVRSGPGTEYGVLQIVRKDARLTWKATAANGWHAVLVDGEAGWIGPKYSRLEGEK